MSDIYSKFTPAYIQERYKFIEAFYTKYLYEFGVKMPGLYKNEKTQTFTRDALVLVYLAEGYPNTQVVSKSDLTNFIRNFFTEVNDVQQARHLGAQNGFWIAAGGRDNIVVNLNKNQYKLHSLDKPYPNYKRHRQLEQCADFPSIKLKYNNRCATCGSQEGQPHLHWPQRKTVLQQGHMNPQLPLTLENTIPQCSVCNRADRNRWVYDDKGRVIAVASLAAMEGCSEQLAKQIVDHFRAKFKF